MTNWQNIETAPKDDEPILLACFIKNDPTPIYIVMATWGTDMPGYTHCASYSGWFVDCIPLEDPPRRRGIEVANGILSRIDYAPTHWMPIQKTGILTNKTIQLTEQSLARILKESFDGGVSAAGGDYTSPELSDARDQTLFYIKESLK